MTGNADILAVALDDAAVPMLSDPQLAGAQRLLLLTPRGRKRAIAMEVRDDPRIVQVIEMEEPGREQTRSRELFLNFMDEGRLEQAVLLSASPARSLKFRPRAVVPDMQPLFAWARWCKLMGVQRIEAMGPDWDMDAMPERTLDDFVGRHEGERCFVIGNGPSLNKIDMGLLKHEITLGSNRCFLGFENWGFDFTYWAIEDKLQIEEYLEEYQEGLPDSIPKFLPAEYMAYARFPNAVYFDLLYGNGRSFSDGMSFPAFSAWPHRMYNGFTVTYSLIQIAALMGCKEIYLIGLDHNYGLSTKKLASVHGGDQSTWSSSDTAEATHFDSRYTAGNKKFVKPRPINAEIAYACARQWCAMNGVTIKNATPGTHLDIYETVDFNSLF